MALKLISLEMCEICGEFFLLIVFKPLSMADSVPVSGDH